jgi:hypothetical protein
MPSTASLHRYLRALLYRELYAVEARDPSLTTKVTAFALHKLIDSFDALKQGDVRSIFTPTPKRAKGAYPAMLFRCRQQAVKDVKVLTELCGWKVFKAVDEVAKAYGTSPENVRSWRKTLEPMSEPTIRVGKVMRPVKLLQFDVSEDEILKAIKVSGAKYIKVTFLKK